MNCPFMFWKNGLSGGFFEAVFASRVLLPVVFGNNKRRGYVSVFG